MAQLHPLLSLLQRGWTTQRPKNSYGHTQSKLRKTMRPQISNNSGLKKLRYFKKLRKIPDRICQQIPSCERKWTVVPFLCENCQLQCSEEHPEAAEKRKRWPGQRWNKKASGAKKWGKKGITGRQKRYHAHRTETLGWPMRIVFQGRQKTAIRRNLSTRRKRCTTK